MTPSSRFPDRNPQHPPSPKFRPDLNHVRSSSNFQDSFCINYQHDLWCQRWPHPPTNLQSGTKPPCNQKLTLSRYLAELSLYLTKKQPNPHPWGLNFSQLNHVRSSSKFQDIFHIIYQHDIWYQRWPPHLSLQSGTLNLLQVPNLGQIKSCRIFFSA